MKNMIKVMTRVMTNQREGTGLGLSQRYGEPELGRGGRGLISSLKVPVLLLAKLDLNAERHFLRDDGIRSLDVTHLDLKDYEYLFSLWKPRPAPKLNLPLRPIACQGRRLPRQKVFPLKMEVPPTPLAKGKNKVNYKTF